MTETPEPSDQLPEEGPEGQAPDDEGSSEEQAHEQAEREGHDPGTQEQATGNPDNAG
jgi:hypothetical protein